MTARFPASVIAPESSSIATRPDVLRALLGVADDGTVVRFSLVDSRGDTQLRRTLPAPGRGRPISECLALADTLAAIVERYLGTISYDAGEFRLPEAAAPATPVTPVTPLTPEVAVITATATPKPLPRATLVLLGVGWRMPMEAEPPQGELEGRLGAEVELTTTYPRIAALISLGAAPPVTSNKLDEGRTATLRRFPARLGASIKLAAGPGWVEPALAIGVDLLAISSTAGSAAQATATETFRLSPGVEAAVGYRLKIAGSFHVRPRAAVGMAIRPYHVGLREAPEEIIFATPRAYASFGIDTGVLFR